MYLSFACRVVAIFIAGLLLSFTHPNEEPTTYKCLIQMVNYEGEGAYMAVSILDENKKYVETLRILGDDDEWHPQLEEWYFSRSHELRKSNADIDGITGATVGGGERSIFAIPVPAEYLDKGYSLRIESAVEYKKYVLDEVLVPLNRGELEGKHRGNEYIRYFRIQAE